MHGRKSAAGGGSGSAAESLPDVGAAESLSGGGRKSSSGLIPDTSCSADSVGAGPPSLLVADSISREPGGRAGVCMAADDNAVLCAIFGRRPRAFSPVHRRKLTGLQHWMLAVG
eukprot:scaffold35922_cov65-Phaeocystis_antarctica.AAC.8